MLKSFSQYLTEDAAKDVVFAFGRFNPPTIGHEKLIEKVAEIAQGRSYRIYASQNEDTKKNPLSLTEKVKFMRKMFPRHARAIMPDTEMKNTLQICSKLYEQGFTRVTMVVTEDRANEYRTLLNTYNGKTQIEGGFYNFKEGVNIAVSLPRDPDSDDRQRLAASANDFELFCKNLPVALEEKCDLFNAVRSGMGLKESHNFRKHIQLESVSDRREAYVAGDLFAVGNQVVIKESDEIGAISYCGSNYLIVELTNGKKVRKWLKDVELLEHNIVVSTDTTNSAIPAPQVGFVLPPLTYRAVSTAGKCLSALRKA